MSQLNNSRKIVLVVLIALVSAVINVDPVAAQEQKSPLRSMVSKKKSRAEKGGILQSLWNRITGRKSEESVQPAGLKAEKRIKIEETIEDFDRMDAEQLNAAEISSKSVLQSAPDDRGPGKGAPATGPLGLIDLIELGLRNSDEVVQRRTNIKTAEAWEAAANDWDDPELRVSFDRDNDRELQRPYTVREDRYTDRRGRDVTNQVTRERLKGNTITDRELRNEREIIHERIEDRVTPGAGSDRTDRKVTTNSRTTRNDSRTSQSVDSNGFSSDPIREDSRQTTNSRVTERSRFIEENPFDPTEPQSSFLLRVRFPIPNFMEMKQRLIQAKGETGRARAEYKAARNEVIWAIRDAYERIEYLNALNQLDEQKLSYSQTYLSELTSAQEAYDKLVNAAALVPDIAKELRRPRADEIIAARNEIFEIEREIDQNRHGINTEKVELARLAGIGDPTRIVFTDTLVEIDLDAAAINKGFLKAMAIMNRPELSELKHRLEISESEVAEEKLKRIPFAKFIDIGYGQSFENGERERDEFSAQIAISLPLASIFKNKSADAYQEKANSYAERIKRFTDRVGNDVERAVFAVQTSRDNLLRTRVNLQHMQTLVKKNAADLEAANEDVSRVVESVFEDREAQIDSQESVVSAVRDFNQSVRALEEALGTELKNAFGKAVVGKATAGGMLDSAGFDSEQSLAVP